MDLYNPKFLFLNCMLKMAYFFKFVAMSGIEPDTECL